MNTDFHKLLITTLAIIQIAIFHYGNGCMVEYCADIYSERLDEGGIFIGMNAPYCQIITDYIYCLIETNRTCRGNLKYHTLQTLLHRQRREFSCSSFPETMKPSNYVPIGCAFPIDTAPHAMQRYCALFGSRHLRTLNGHFVTCAHSGAYPLINNKHLLIQITHSFLGSATTAISKITVIVKENERCTSRKQYEVGSEDEELPNSFTDGSIFVGNSGRKAVEIKLLNRTYVEIMLRYIATTIYIRRHGAYLSVALRIPERIVQEQTDNEFDICTSGCSRSDMVKLEEALANPISFTRCHGVHVKIPLKIAIERCSRANITDAFFDACVFDFLISGDEMFIAQIADAQYDIINLYSPYIRHYFTGRQNLTLYDSKAGYKWKQCTRESSLNLEEQISGSTNLQQQCNINGLVTLLLFFIIFTYKI
ncbi:Repulsive guidance molecule (RGM) C-terminus family protein [Acanthocheilonema viteae]